MSWSFFAEHLEGTDFTRGNTVLDVKGTQELIGSRIVYNLSLIRLTMITYSGPIHFESNDVLPGKVASQDNAEGNPMKFQVFVWRVASDLFHSISLMGWCRYFGSNSSISNWGAGLSLGAQHVGKRAFTILYILLHTFIMHNMNEDPTSRAIHPLERIGLLSVLKLSSITTSISHCRTVPHLAGGEARCGTVARKSRAVRFRARVMACSWSCLPFSCAVCRLKSFEYIWQRWKSRGTRLWYWIACKGGEVTATVHSVRQFHSRELLLSTKRHKICIRSIVMYSPFLCYVCPERSERSLGVDALFNDSMCSCSIFSCFIFGATCGPLLLVFYNMNIFDSIWQLGYPSPSQRFIMVYPSSIVEEISNCAPSVHWALWVHGQRKCPNCI